MSSLFSVYLPATAVQLYVQGKKCGLFCYFYVNFIDASEVMLLVVVVDKSIIQRTICSILSFPESVYRRAESRSVVRSSRREVVLEKNVLTFCPPLFLFSQLLSAV